MKFIFLNQEPISSPMILFLEHLEQHGNQLEEPIMEWQMEIKYSSVSEELGTLVCVTTSKRKFNNCKKRHRFKSGCRFFFCFFYLYLLKQKLILCTKSFKNCIQAGLI